MELFGNAIVFYRDKAITAIASLRDGSEAATTDVELVWTIICGEVPEASSKMAGSPCDFGLAIEAFQTVISKADEPVFTASSNAVAAPSLRGGAL